MRIFALTAMLVLSSSAFAAEPAPAKKEATKESKAKAKVGDACKAPADCDSSRCTNGKCEAAQVVHPPT